VAGTTLDPKAALVIDLPELSVDQRCIVSTASGILGEVADL
jgi:hypothetical protein